MRLLSLSIVASLLLIATPSLAAEEESNQNVFYICQDETAYPNDPSYSGGFCVDGQLGVECIIIHYWTDSNGSDESCYLENPVANS